MIDSCIEHYTNSDLLCIPIGKMNQHLFEKIKPLGYQNFIGLYEILVSHTIWVLEPRFEKNSKPICNVYIDCNLCGKTIFDKFTIVYGH